MSAVIRAAQPGEGPLILSLIRELADYEKLLHEVQATVVMIEAALFGDTPAMFCNIAELEGEPVGMAIWYPNFSTFAGKRGIYLEDLFVRPAFRGKGIGKAILRDLAATCVERGWSVLKWSVLDWNAPSIAFYKSLGATLMDEWTVCRVDGDALTALAKRAG